MFIIQNAQKEKKVSETPNEYNKVETHKKKISKNTYLGDLIRS